MVSDNHGFNLISGIADNNEEVDTDVEGDTLVQEVSLEDDDHDYLNDDVNYRNTSNAEYSDVHDIFFNEIFGAGTDGSRVSVAHDLLEAINKLENECKKPTIRKQIRKYSLTKKLGDIDGLVPYIKTRWTYSVLCFERALLLAPCLKQLMKEGSLSPLLSECDFECIKVYILLLKPFQTITSFFNSPETTSRYLLPALSSYKDAVLPHITRLKAKLDRSQLGSGLNDKRTTVVLAQIERFLNKIEQYTGSYEQEKLLVVSSYFNCGYRNLPYLMRKLGLGYEMGNNKKNNELLSRRISNDVTDILFPMLNIHIESFGDENCQPRVPGIMSIVFDDGSETVDNTKVDESHFRCIFHSMVLKEVQSFNNQYNKMHVQYTEDHMKGNGTIYDGVSGMFKLSDGTNLSDYEYLLLTMRDVHHKIWGEIKNCPILTLFNHLMDSIAVSSTHIEHIFSISSILTNKRRGRITPESLEKRMKAKIAYMALGNYHKFDLNTTSLDQMLFVRKTDS